MLTRQAAYCLIFGIKITESKLDDFRFLQQRALTRAQKHLAAPLECKCKTDPLQASACQVMEQIAKDVPRTNFIFSENEVEEDPLSEIPIDKG